MGVAGRINYEKEMIVFTEPPRPPIVKEDPGNQHRTSFRPIESSWLANSAEGNLSALVGPNDDTSLLQISAPVQPGNGGGPLLDQSGNVIGVVVSRLYTLKIARATGDIPGNSAPRGAIGVPAASRPVSDV